MCCHGCQAVANAIVASGNERFYKHRTAPSPTGAELLPDFIQQTRVYDHPEVQKTFVRDAGDNLREAALILEGITCAACVWLNEPALRRLRRRRRTGAARDTGRGERGGQLHDPPGARPLGRQPHQAQ